MLDSRLSVEVEPTAATIVGAPIQPRSNGRLHPFCLCYTGYLYKLRDIVGCASVQSC
ncbi:hypothetical protein Hdeb2414_s0006g00193811 [Helianthus debilis subsp. tardiflorus]